MPGWTYAYLIESAPSHCAPLYVCRLPRPGGIPGGCSTNVEEACRYSTREGAQAVLETAMNSAWGFRVVEHWFHA